MEKFKYRLVQVADFKIIAKIWLDCLPQDIFTLFGEEIVPEQQKAVGRSRAKKKEEPKEKPKKPKTKKEEPIIIKALSSTCQVLIT